MAESLDTGINTYNYQPTLYILGKVASFTESVGPDFKMNPGSTLLDYGAGDGAIAAALVLKYEINRADLVDTDRIESVPNVLSGRVRCFKSPRNKIEIPSDCKYGAATFIDSLHWMREIGDEDLLSGFKKIAAQLDQVGKIIVICTRGDSEEVENNRRLKTLLNDPELNSVIIHNSTALKAGDLSRVSKIVFGDQLPT